jgi:type II secretory pathway component PulC
MVKQGLKFFEDLKVEETLAPFIASEKGRYASFAVLALAGVLLLLALVNMVGSWHADFIISHSTTASTGMSNYADNETAQIDKIPALHVFGYQATEDTDFLPVTSAQLRLTGILRNPENNSSRVIISSSGQTGKIFSIGDEVLSGIKINAVNDDSVVLERGGRFEKLPLVRTALLFKEQPKSLW